jgi:hypothetical protein
MYLELDRVLGSRKVNVNDRITTHYVEAVMLEIVNSIHSCTKVFIPISRKMCAYFRNSATN